MNKHTTSTNLKQSFKRKDDRLLLLQKSITDKLAQTKDGNLIKLYLQQAQHLAEQRLQPRKAGQQ